MRQLHQLDDRPPRPSLPVDADDPHDGDWLALRATIEIDRARRLLAHAHQLHGRAAQLRSGAEGARRQALAVRGGPRDRAAV